jgi:hypothetical protein
MPETTNSVTTAENKLPTFGARLMVSAVILLIIGFILGSFWFILLITGDGRGDLLGSGLPPRTTLTEVEGKVIAVNTYSSIKSNVPRTFYIPVVEYTVNNTTHQLRSVNSYNPSPLKQGEVALVLYTPSDPAKAWQKWEYDKLLNEYNNIGVGDIIRIVPGILALILLLPTFLFIMVYLFSPRMLKSFISAPKNQ